MNYLRFHEGNRNMWLGAGESQRRQKFVIRLFIFQSTTSIKKGMGLFKRMNKTRGRLYCFQCLLHTKCPHRLNRLVLGSDHRIVPETLLSPWKSRYAPIGHQVLLMCILSMTDNRLCYIWINISSCILTIEKNAPERYCSSHARIDKTIMILDPGADEINKRKCLQHVACTNIPTAKLKLINPSWMDAWNIYI